mmetsp:Transcript_70135/g.203395  ORF Transcript_70135/g.203395 Transcript_70135/m.203395 type:complete len:95 (-) Transcript_70135:364-648(-)
MPGGFDGNICILFVADTTHVRQKLICHKVDGDFLFIVCCMVGRASKSVHVKPWISLFGFKLFCYSRRRPPSESSKERWSFQREIHQNVIRNLFG